MIPPIRTLLGLLAISAACGACRGNAAANDLEKLKQKTCGCKAEDDSCIDEAKEMARQWVEKHDSTPRAEVVEAITECSLEVGLELN